MVRPEQALDSQCSMWEEQIDQHLRSHDWLRGADACVVIVQTANPNLRYLLDRYRALGWCVRVEDTDVVEYCTTCYFTMSLLGVVD